MDLVCLQYLHKTVRSNFVKEELSFLEFIESATALAESTLWNMNMFNQGCLDRWCNECGQHKLEDVLPKWLANNKCTTLGEWRKRLSEGKWSELSSRYIYSKTSSQKFAENYWKPLLHSKLAIRNWKMKLSLWQILLKTIQDSVMTKRYPHTN